MLLGWGDRREPMRYGRGSCVAGCGFKLSPCVCYAKVLAVGCHVQPRSPRERCYYFTLLLQLVWLHRARNFSTLPW